MRRIIVPAVLAAVSIGAIGACSNYKEANGDKATVRSETAELEHKAKMNIADVKTEDPGIQKFFDSAYGYAVFPTVAKGGLGVGGAHGKGLVYEHGNLVGTTTLSQATVGAQIGGQAYTEIIFFQNKGSLDNFKQGNAEFSAQASAVAAKAGASANADYANGVAIFTHEKGGLMGEASVGGQKFSYTPL